MGKLNKTNSTNQNKLKKNNPNKTFGFRKSESCVGLTSIVIRSRRQPLAYRNSKPICFESCLQDSVQQFFVHIPIPLCP